MQWNDGFLKSRFTWNKKNDKIYGHKSQRKRQQADLGLPSQSHVTVKVLRLAIKECGSWSVTSTSAREFDTDDQTDGKLSNSKDQIKVKKSSVQDCTRHCSFPKSETRLNKSA